MDKAQKADSQSVNHNHVTNQSPMRITPTVSKTERSGHSVSPASVSRLIGWRDLQICRLHPPDLTRVLRDGAIAGEFPRVGDVFDHNLGPFFRVLKITW